MKFSINYVQHKGRTSEKIVLNAPDTNIKSNGRTDTKDISKKSQVLSTDIMNKSVVLNTASATMIKGN